MKRNSIMFTFVCLFILLLSNTSYGADSYAMSSPVQSTSSIQVSDNNNICLPTTDAKRLVLELRVCKLQAKALISCTNSNIELAQQVSLLREEVELLQQKYEITNNLLLKNEEIYKQKYDVLNDELTEAKKPRWGSLLTSGALGAVLMGLAIIVL